MSVMKFMYSVVALCERILLYSTEQVFINTFQKFLNNFFRKVGILFFMRKERADKPAIAHFFIGSASYVAVSLMICCSV